MTALARTAQPEETQAHPVSALALVETVTAVQVFTENGLDNILERIEREARTAALDISTKKGREEIRSLAARIAKSKTAIEEMGKGLVAPLKAEAKKIDAERARAWDRLEALQKEVRQPLTEWENREKERIAKHEAALASIAELGNNIAANWLTIPLAAMNTRLQELHANPNDWQEFSVRAKQAIETAADSIASAILKRQKHDAEQAELVRLRKEEEERKQRDHEDRLKAEAAEKARIAAEAKAKREAEAEAARVAAEKAKADQERQRVQREKEEAEAKAAKAELDLIAAEERAQREKEEAEANRIAAEKKAREDARIAAQRAAADKKAAEEAAAKRERDRIAAEQKAEAEATAKREADKKHRAKINSEAMTALLSIMISDAPEHATQIQINGAMEVVKAIAKGEIPHIRIQY